MEIICDHKKTEMLARRDGVDYVRCLGCGQVFEAEDLERPTGRAAGDSTRRNPASKIYVADTSGESLIALGLTFIVVGVGFFLAWANPTA